MLRDFTSHAWSRYTIPWEGFALSASIDSSGVVHGLHDQDFVHNGKKLVNPLNSSMKFLQLGPYVCCHEHIRQVYNKFKYDDHDLRVEDASRDDQQNWASAQRMYAAKCRSSLRQLSLLDDGHNKRTLGTKLYLEMCSSYVDIFLSVSLSLRE